MPTCLILSRRSLLSMGFHMHSCAGLPRIADTYVSRPGVFRPKEPWMQSVCSHAGVVLWSMEHRELDHGYGPGLVTLEDVLLFISSRHDMVKRARICNA